MVQPAFAIFTAAASSFFKLRARPKLVQSTVAVN